MQALEHELDRAGDRGGALAAGRGARPRARRAGQLSTSAASSADGTSSPVCTTVPSSNAATTSRTRSGADPLLEHGRAPPPSAGARRSARRGPPRASRSRPCPLVDAASASRSLTRGTTSFSPRRSARRAALATSVSWLANDEPHRHAGALVDVRLWRARWRQRGHDLGHVVGHRDAQAGGVERPGLLAHDRHLGLDVERVVRADLRAEAVLQRRDDAAAVRVVLGVGRRDSITSSGRRIL